MTFFYIEPEVAGYFGDNTIIDAGTFPQTVSNLHCIFDGWLGDKLLELFPVYIIVEDLAKQLIENQASGLAFDDVEVEMSEQFSEFYPDLQLPQFKWLKVIGNAGVEDFGMAADHRMVISERILRILQSNGLAHCILEEYRGH